LENEKITKAKKMIKLSYIIQAIRLNIQLIYFTAFFAGLVIATNAAPALDLQLLFAIIALSPNPFSKGVEIQSIDSNSTASISGLAPGMVIKSLSGTTIDNQEDFANAITSINAGDIVEVITDKGTFKFLAEETNGVVNLGLNVDKAKTSKLKLGIDLMLYS